MSIPKKIDPQFAKKLRSWLSRMNISKQRVIIDLENDTIEVDEDYPAQEILDSIGIISPERGKELAREIQQMREDDWE